MELMSKAVLQALLVTFLWSTSWVLVKIGLKDIPALTFAGLRYTLAFAVVLLFIVYSGGLASVKGLARRDWLLLVILGVLYHSVTQGTQFLALEKLPAVTLSLLLNFSAIVVALMGIVLLAEYPSRRQWLGVAIFIAGVLVYFYPVSLPAKQAWGLAIGFVSVLANAASSVLGHYINREARLLAQTVTVVSMGIGALLLLGTGIAIQGLPALSFTDWLIVLWLAIVNTAFAFTLWNHTLRILSAVESSVINNTMLVQIAVLARIFLGERITLREGFGLVVSAIGILIVQLRPTPKA
jgi:drug/metabolite transporter (DMT)-like permease